MKIDNSTLHIYGQRSYHEPAYIVANKEGLTQLRDLLNKAIAADKPQTEHFFPTDGEGFNIVVVPYDKQEKLNLASWYTSNEPHLAAKEEQTDPRELLEYLLTKEDFSNTVPKFMEAAAKEQELNE